MRHITFDPYLSASDAAEEGVELVDLDTLLRISDLVCTLTPETHHLLNADRLELMKPTAYLINTARENGCPTAALRV